ncbi:MAG: hypothetical protein MJK08_08110 [Campylobacterales bacterium]|nr:hypothetical protein [Campylobacterales bacterium]
MILKSKVLFLIFLFVHNLFAIDVLVSKNNIAYKDIIKLSNLKIVKVEKLQKTCKALKINDLKKRKYISKHYINKKSIICLKDIKIYKKDSVIFNFGTIEIEKDGIIVYENDNYITIKKRNGKLEKIYKNGIK